MKVVGRWRGGVEVVDAIQVSRQNVHGLQRLVHEKEYIFLFQTLGSVIGQQLNSFAGDGQLYFAFVEEGGKARGSGWLCQLTAALFVLLGGCDKCFDIGHVFLYGQGLNFGITVNYAHIYYPDIVGKEEVYRVANWLYGCHPYHNYSFVAVVGAARPKQVFYGNNRADFSFIPGNVAPGLLFRKPDHFENFDDWPFLWGQNEGTIAGNTQYIIFGSALKDIVKRR